MLHQLPRALGAVSVLQEHLHGPKARLNEETPSQRAEVDLTRLSNEELVAMISGAAGSMSLNKVMAAFAAS
jgi:hypothetical protein